MAVKAVILAGGPGTRLRPLTNNRPKCLVEVCNRPILDHIIELFSSFNINQILISVGFLKENVIEHCGDGSRFGVIIDYLKEDSPLGTAGPLLLAKGVLTETFMVSNGDELKDIDIEKMLGLHRRNRALCTIALTKVADPTHYGVARLEGERICEFVEKPKEPPSSFINAGFYIMEPEVIGMIPPGFATLEKDIFPLIAKMGRLYGFRFDGQWFDCGSMERLETANKNWKGISHRR